MARRDKYDIIQFPKQLNALEAARELKEKTSATHIYAAVLAAIVEANNRANKETQCTSQTTN